MATQRTADASPHFAGPAYGVGVLFVVFPLLDVVVQAWPIVLGNPTWRYGAVGIGANYTISLVFGMWLLCYTAGRQLHRRTLVVLAILALLMAVASLVAILGFVLDGLQIRPSVPRDPARALWMFDAGMQKALVKYAASALVLAWLAVSSRRALRDLPGREDAPRLVRDSKG